MSQTDLLGDPLPDPLPENERLKYWSDLEGHTIAATFEDPLGRFDVELVIVTTTGCWLVVSSEIEDSEHSRIYVEQHTGEVLSDFVSARELLNAGLISQVEFTQLDGVEKARKEEENKRKAERLRKQLAELEAPKP